MQMGAPGRVWWRLVAFRVDAKITFVYRRFQSFSGSLVCMKKSSKNFSSP